MARMGITAPYRKPNTSRKHPRHPVYPYRLRGLAALQRFVWKGVMRAPECVTGSKGWWADA